jgi:uncharacterized protein (DUF2249 family)
MSEQAIAPNERIVDVREVNPGVRHTIILQLVQHLRTDETLQLIVDHDPRRLKLQLEAKYGAGLSWNALEKGPNLWRARIGRTGRS